MQISEKYGTGLVVVGVGTMLLGVALKAATKEVNWKALAAIETVGIGMAIGGCCGRGSAEDIDPLLFTAEQLGEKIEQTAWGDQGHSIVPSCDEAKLFLKLTTPDKAIHAVRTVKGEDLVPLFEQAVREIRQEVEGALPEGVKAPSASMKWAVILHRKGDRLQCAFWDPSYKWGVTGAQSGGGGFADSWHVAQLATKLKQWEQMGIMESWDQFSNRSAGSVFRDDNDFQVEDIAP